jgi:hypothetical protein
MSVLSYQHELAKILFAEDATSADFAKLGASGDRFLVYRRMVRSRLTECIEHGFERFVGVAGRDAFRSMVSRFLATSPPRSPYLRDVPGEFLAFFEQHAEALEKAHDLPPYARDLARYEWSELETAYSAGEVQHGEITAFDMHRPAFLSPAHRLIDVAYPVHRLGVGGHDGEMAKEPFSLCLYRDTKTHEVTALELTPVTARMFRLMTSQTMPLTEVVRNAAAALDVRVDVAFVDALSTLLADLTERGVLLGSLSQKETT